MARNLERKQTQFLPADFNARAEDAKPVVSETYKKSDKAEYRRDSQVTKVTRATAMPVRMLSLNEQNLVFGSAGRHASNLWSALMSWLVMTYPKQKAIDPKSEQFDKLVAEERKAIAKATRLHLKGFHSVNPDSLTVYVSTAARFIAQFGTDAAIVGRTEDGKPSLLIPRGIASDAVRQDRGQTPTEELLNSVIKRFDKIPVTDSVGTFDKPASKHNAVKLIRMLAKRLNIRPDVDKALHSQGVILDVEEVTPTDDTDGDEQKQQEQAA